MADVPTADCVRERRAGGGTVVEVRGEIDVLTAPVVSARLDALTSSGRPRLVVDLRPVTFMDCAGLSVLCRARGRVRALGGELSLVVDDPRVLDLLRLTGLGHAFTVYSHLPDALAVTG